MLTVFKNQYIIIKQEAKQGDNNNPEIKEREWLWKMNPADSHAISDKQE